MNRREFIASAAAVAIEAAMPAVTKPATAYADGGAVLEAPTHLFGEGACSLPGPRVSPVALWAKGVGVE